MKEPVVVAHSGEDAAPRAPDTVSGWKYLFLIGSGMAVVGLVDLALLFANPQWASLDWEFGTIASAFDGMPLLTLGIGLMCAGAVANHWVVTKRLMLALTLLMTLIVTVLIGFFALDVPAALKAVTPAMQTVIKMAALKTGLLAFTFLVLYLALSIWTWRRLRAPKGV